MADEQLYFNADVYAVNDANPAAEAVAVRDDRIVAVGTEAECRAALGDAHESVDLQGGALLPGFIDTHLHPVLMIYFDLNVDLRGVKAISDLQARMSQTAGETKPDAWVVGLQFEEQDLAEARLPTRHELDSACPDHPAIVIKHDGHTVIANSKAIETANVTAATPDPDGGVIDREPEGAPAGPFRENAAQLMLSAMPMPDMNLFIAGAKTTFDKLAAHGITSVGAVLQTDEEGPAGASGAFDVIAMQMLLSQIPIDTYGILIASDLEKIELAKKSALHDRKPAGRRVGMVKIFSDGTFGSCTAYMNDPFSDQPDKRGFLVHDENEIYYRMTQAHQAGLQIGIHAIGDAANRLCVDLYQRLLNEYPQDDHRHRIEHAPLLDPGAIDDPARLALVASTQPLFIHSEKSWLHQRLGPERARMTYPLRSLLDAGVKVAGASDAPVESIDVLHAISVCVTREGFETGQAITAAEAVRMYTLDAAYAQFQDQDKGSIEVGKLADLVVLSANPVRVSGEGIKEIRVLRTIRGGKEIYRAQ